MNHTDKCELCACHKFECPECVENRGMGMQLWVVKTPDGEIAQFPITGQPMMAVHNRLKDLRECLRLTIEHHKEYEGCKIIKLKEEW